LKEKRNPAADPDIKASSYSAPFLYAKRAFIEFQLLEHIDKTDIQRL
jgi:hypothetical protein